MGSKKVYFDIKAKGKPLAVLAVRTPKKVHTSSPRVLSRFNRLLSKKLRRTDRKIKKSYHRLSKRFGKSRVIWFGLGFFVAILAIIAFGTTAYIRNLITSNYQLSVSEQTLIGQPDNSLLKQYTFDSKAQSFYLSKAAIGSSSTSMPSDTVSVGGSVDNQAKFSLELPLNAQKGITTYDNESGLSFTMVPQFSTWSAKQVAGHTVYPFGLNGPKAVYTVKGNGVQEDIIYTKAPKGTVKLQYKLQLPNTLQARMMPGGNLGIYSATPYLFGNISYGSAADEQKVQLARQNSAKNNLVFVLPAPEIVTGDGVLPSTSSRHAALSLSGDTVTITASGLGNLFGPVAIDPSVVDSAASNFMNNGNNESDITYDTTNNQVIEANLDGGSIGASWTATTFSTSGPVMPARFAFGAVAYNGYLYVMGGTQQGASSGDCITANNEYCNGVFYASITNGTVGSWASTTAFPASAPVMPARAYFQAEAYNGFLYVLGGAEVTGSSGDCTVTNGTYFFCNGTFYAPICTGNNSGFDGCSSTAGTIGSWASTTAFPTSAPVMEPRDQFAAVAYNGYMYVMGGYAPSTGSDCTGGGDYCSGTFYAPIDGNGTIGAWASTTAFTTARIALSAVAYNGYLYMMGGVANASGGDCTAASFYCNGVFSAPILASGAIGAWTATTAFPASAPVMDARKLFRAVVYDGYLYVTGGVASAATGDCTATSDNCNGTFYAPIGTNGSIGAWSQSTTLYTTSSMPARYGQGSVIYNGYLVVMGGMDQTTSGDCTSNVGCNGVFTIPLNGTGITGAYITSSNTFTTGERGGVVVAYDGYLYVMGGDAGGTPVNTIYYAAIANNGSIGTLTTTNGFTTARTFFAAVAYEGYMYVLGGCTSAYASCTTGTNDIATVYSSPIAAAGTLSATWTASTSFTTGRYGLGAFAYNGYMYIVGGVNATTYERDVQYALICTNQHYNNGTSGCGATAGVLGTTWTTQTNYLNTARAFFGTAVYGGYVYVAGGETTGSAELATVEYAPINADTAEVFTTPTGGLTATFTASGNSFTNARQGLTAVANNGFLYITGGYNGSATYYADTQYAQITPSTGAIGTFSTATSFANAAYGVSAAAYNGFIYIAGGYNGTTYYNDVYYAPISNQGPGTIQPPGGWNSTSILYDAVGSSGRVVYNGFIYVLGGWLWGSPNAWPTTVVQYTLICTGSNSGTDGCGSTPGTLGTWAAANSLIFNSAHDSVNNTCDQGLANPSAAEYGGFVYVIGGFSEQPTGTAYNSGAANYDFNVSNEVQYALVCTGSNSGTDGCSSTVGSLGTWTLTTNYPQYTAQGIAAAANGYLYGSAGCTAEYCDDPGSVTGLTYYALICTGSNNGTGGCGATAGTVGTWTATATQPEPSDIAAEAVYNGYLYSVGGWSGNNWGVNFPYVYYTVFCNGSNNGVDGCTSTAGPVGTWLAATNLPIPSYSGDLVAANGFMYYIGGNSLAYGGGTAQVFEAPINNNGSLGNWTATTSLPLPSAALMTITADGYVWALGAANQYNAPADTVYYAYLNAMPRVGTYSDNVDFTGLSNDDPTPIEMITHGGDCSSGLCTTELTNQLNGDNVGGYGGIFTKYSFASNACPNFSNAAGYLVTQSTFLPNWQNSLGTIVHLTDTTNACSTTNVGRFMHLTYVLDDSGTATFPDATANHSAISGVTIWYHPAASNRLRGGMTFSNGALQSLDTPP